ncbi:MAG: hypothetical protein NE327_03050 [Lentisphaeraceae bacterium]|nr:hypothetical protein [Lentisphaeraceae bacterium]
MIYPKIKDTEQIGSYPAKVFAGGGYVWDEVLEYRVWCSPMEGAEDIEDGNDYYYVFEDYSDALAFYKQTKGAEEPLALVLQKEYIDEPEEEVYVHKKEERLTEWPVEFLSRPRRTESTLPDFFAPDAPSNRIDIIRGLA